MASKKYDSNQQKFADKLFAAYPDLGSTANEVFAKIANYDPTADYKSDKHQYIYLEWIASRVLKEKPRAQDLYKIKEDLELYSTLTRLDKWRASRPGTVFYRPFVNPEIGKYSIAELAVATLPYINKADRKKSATELEDERAKAETETRILYDGPEGRIVLPMTTEASQFWGKGTKWCISATKADNLFEKYYEDGKYPVIMFLPKGTRDKFAFNEYDSSSARNMMDVGIIDPYQKIKDLESPDLIILANLVASALTSPDFKMAEVEKDPQLTRAFELFALWNPSVYQHIVRKIGNDHLPAIMKPDHLLSFCESYLKADDSFTPVAAEAEVDHDNIDEKRRLVKNFASLDTVIFSMTTNPAFRTLRQEVIDEGEWRDTEQVIWNMAENTITPPDTPFERPEDYIADFGAKYAEMIKIRDLGDDHYRDMVTENIDTASILYMKQIPAPFWKDEDFSLNFILSGEAYGSNFIDMIPEAYNHPKVLKHLFSMMDIDILSENLREHDFHSAWTGTIDGIPVLEIITELRDIDGNPIIDDMTTALYLYEAMGQLSEADGVDMSPIARKLEALYPDGLDEADDILYASQYMPLCDLTALLEKTIKRDPSLFADIAPEKQTMPMAIAAVQHDPGSLADIAQHLFKATTKSSPLPPELTAAFNKLPPGSMEREAVQDYFMTPEIK